MWNWFFKLKYRRLKFIYFNICITLKKSLTLFLMLEINSTVLKSVYKSKYNWM